MSCILKIDKVSKIFPGVKALQNVSLDLKRGEVLALVGENGAGKSTLIKICGGAHAPTSGTIIIDEQEFKELDPELSMDNGIAIIYQEFNLVNDLPIYENVFLGRAIRHGIFIDKKTMIEKTRQYFKQLEIDIEPTLLIKDLTVGYQQIVEIVKAISQNAKILIMDEPSAALTNAEVEKMLDMVERLRDKGMSIIYISHRLDEVFRLADRIAILRDGQYIDTLDKNKTDRDKLITLMVGRELTEVFPTRENSIKDEILFEAKELFGNGNKNISFKINKGEILGIGGLVGAGRTEIAEMLFGVVKPQSGQMFLEGQRYQPKHPQEAIEKGVAFVTEDRKKYGAILNMDVKVNISMAILKKISKFIFINKKAENNLALKYKEDLLIKTPSISQAVVNLSGGNQQKVILAKWLAADSKLIILDEPTRGIDIGAKREIYLLINKLVKDGKTILLISSEMEELLGLSDRIIVLAEGHLTGVLNKNEFSQERVINYASKI